MTKQKRYGENGYPWGIIYIEINIIYLIIYNYKIILIEILRI